MGRTIIQPIGPLYGEAVNGTVFGRPNGSIYVPPTNTITVTLKESYVRNYTATVIALCDSTGLYATSGSIKIVAQSQDIAAYMRGEISTDEDFATIDGTLTYTAGLFNYSGAFGLINDNLTIVDGETYYYRVVLYSGTGVAVATSETITLTGVVPE